MFHLCCSGQQTYLVRLDWFRNLYTPEHSPLLACDWPPHVGKVDVWLLPLAVMGYEFLIQALGLMLERRRRRSIRMLLQCNSVTQLLEFLFRTRPFGFLTVPQDLNNEKSNSNNGTEWTERYNISIVLHDNVWCGVVGRLLSARPLFQVLSPCARQGLQLPVRPVTPGWR